MRQVGYGYPNPAIRSEFLEFALECAAYNNTSVFIDAEFIYIDSNKGGRTFEPHLPRGLSLECVRALSMNENMASMCGEDHYKPSMKIVLGDHECFGHVYRVRINKF
ncbi:MAG: hypothetical protein ACO3FL_04380 [Ilumatobacteraceae bacterium]